MVTAFREEEKIELFVPWVSHDGHTGLRSDGGTQSRAAFGVNAGSQAP